MLLRLDEGGVSMAGKLLDLSHATQRQAFTILVDGFLKLLSRSEDRAKTYVSIVNAVGKFQISLKIITVIPLENFYQ